MSVRMFGSFFVLPLALLAPAAALAHATPLSYDPDPSLSQDGVPSAVMIRFSERIEPGAFAVRIFAPSGGSANADPPTVDQNDPWRVIAPVRASGEGAYGVAWSVVSADDGHFTKGAFSFSVGIVAGAANPAAVVNVTHSSAAPEAATLFAELLGQALFLAALALLRGGKDQAERRMFALLAIIAPLLVLCGGAGYLVLKTIDYAGGDIAFSAALSVIAQTTTGRYTLYRMAIAAILLAWSIASRKRLSTQGASRTALRLALAALILMVILRARVSHAAASEFLPVFGIFVNAVHLFFKELWIGGAVAVAAFVFAFRTTGDGARKSLAGRFGRLAAVACAVGGPTGAYIVWMHLKSFANLQSDWGDRFFVLSVLAAFLIVARIATTVATRTYPQYIARTFAAEGGIALAVLFVSSMLIITTPPLDRPGIFELSRSADTAHIALSHDTRDAANFHIDVHDKRKVTELIVSLTNPDENIGPLVPPVDTLGYNSFAIPALSFAPPGNWTVQVAARREGAYDANASFSLRYPDDIPATSRTKRPFGLFDGAMVAAGITALIGSRLLWRWAVVV